MTDAHRILVVDDDEDLRFSAVRTLREAGHEVAESATGEEAMERLVDLKPDLVLLDVNLPGACGPEICRRIKGNPEFAAILVVMVSSLRTSSDDQSDGLDSGADGYIARPIPNRELVARVESLLRLRRAEDARLAAERSYREIFDSSPDAVILHDAESGAILDVNPRMCELFGCSRDDALAKTIGDFCEAAGSDAQDDSVQQMQREASDKPITKEWRGRRLDGESFWCEVTLSLAAVAGEPRVLAFLRDATERRKRQEEARALEKRMLEAQKMESLALMAGGIAHDFNNLLAGILGNASLALVSLPPVSPVQEHIVEIETAAKRAADLARQMLAYSGKGRFVVVELNLNHIVEEMTQLLHSTLPKKVALKPILEEPLPAVRADATQIRQVVMNLITNAAEAIGDRPGTITLATGTVECSAEYLMALADDVDLAAGTYVFLEVSDTGCGMSEATRNRIFDPFFSTKFTGRGLGLAAVHGIVHGHDGAIVVESEPGKGTTFKLLFPRISESASSNLQKKTMTELLKGGGTALLVDDEKMVREVGRRMLEHLGFNVILAEDGEEAIELFREHRSDIRVVLLDLMMPRMGGEEAFRELRAENAEMPVVMCSGYNSQNISQRFADRGFAGFLQKPYRLQDLSDILRQVLGDPSAPGDSNTPPA